MEACTRSNTAHDIYKLDGEVPKTVMSDETSDISQFCKLEWFDWVMFWDKTAPFTDDVLKLGLYIGPSIHFGPALTTKILIQNGQVLNRSMYRALTPDEIKCPRSVHGQSLRKVGVPSHTKTARRLKTRVNPTVLSI